MRLKEEREFERSVGCQDGPKPVEVFANADEFVEQQTEDDAY